MRRRLSLMALLFLGLTCATPAGASWNEIVLFGDSLSDVGNVRQRSSEFLFGLFTTPDDRYFNGRFSNGPVWIEQVGDALALDASTRSYSAPGTNYAHGGATTGGGSANFGIIQNLGNQVTNYLVTEARTPTADTLAVVWGGGNDFLDGGTNTTLPTDNMIGYLQQLYDAGARDFLVPNLPPLGDVPRFLGNPTEAAQKSALIDQHNAYLTQELDAFATLNADATVFELDVAGIFADLLADPATFGITNTTGQAIDAPAGTDVSGWIFWDDVHPTVTGHTLIAQAALDLLIPPVLLVGDYNDDGTVGQFDLNLTLLNWGTDASVNLPIGWDSQPPPGVIGQAELNNVLLNWGNTAEPTAITVPEPALGFMVFTGVLALRRRA